MTFPVYSVHIAGEQYFAGEILEKIEEEFNKIYSLGKEVKTEIPVPVEQLAELQQA